MVQIKSRKEVCPQYNNRKHSIYKGEFQWEGT